MTDKWIDVLPEPGLATVTGEAVVSRRGDYEIVKWVNTGKYGMEERVVFSVRRVGDSVGRSVWDGYSIGMAKACPENLMKGGE